MLFSIVIVPMILLGGDMAKVRDTLQYVQNKKIMKSNEPNYTFKS